jgi:Rieske Fe-S protein
MHRRFVMKTALAAAAGAMLGERLGAQSPDDEALPRENDRLVFAIGAREGELIAPADVARGRPPVLAYAMDPATHMARKSSRLSQIVLVHVDPDELAPETLGRSANGIVAYSAVCTHTGCDVTEWERDAGALLCPCHASQFDPRDGARVLYGPAPGRLAALPLKLVDSMLVAAGGFIGRLGAAE